jgi:hypothetical protein
MKCIYDLILFNMTSLTRFYDTRKFGLLCILYFVCAYAVVLFSCSRFSLRVLKDTATVLVVKTSIKEKQKHFKLSISNAVCRDNILRENRTKNAYSSSKKVILYILCINSFPFAFVRRFLFHRINHQ